MTRNVDRAAFDASAKKAGEPALIPGKYPRAWPIEVFGHDDGSLDFLFVLDGKWQRLPESVCEHAAIEVAICANAEISPLNYARGVAFFLTALRRQGWTVLPPHPEPVFDPMPGIRSQDA